MKHIFLAITLFMQLGSQAQSIKVLNEEKLQIDLDHLALTELQLTIHPQDDRHILLSGMAINPDTTTDYGVFSILTKNAGTTWGNLKRFGVAEGADPWAQITAGGITYSSVLSLTTDIHIYTSFDGGATWKDSLILATGFDHQTMTWDRTNNIAHLVSIKGNTIYINSAKNDSVFNQPKEFSFSNLNSNTMTPVVSSTNKVLIPFTTFQRLSIDSADKVKREWLDKTLSWLVAFDYTKKTFGTPSLICADCERGFPVLAVDESTGAYKGRLYYVCSNQSRNEVLFYYSSNNGAAFTKPKTLARYFNATHTQRNPFTGIPQVAVNNRGEVLVVWQDRSADTTGKCQYLYAAISKDGGKRFSVPQKISSAQSCPENEANGWAGTRYKSGGDYIGIVSRNNGNFFVVWPDSRGGRFQLYSAELKVD